MNQPIMSADDEIANLRAENQALAARLRQSPELREVVGRLRELARQEPRDAKQGLIALLRRLEESQ
jgi:hypothetical protein